MNSFPTILSAQIIIGLPEIIVFLLGAAGLGFAIHFFIFSRRSMPITSPEPSVLAESNIVEPEADRWRIKYYEERETNEQVMQEMQRELDTARENEELMTIETEELKKEIAALQDALIAADKYVTPAPVTEDEEEVYEEEISAVPVQSSGYLSQLKNAHEQLSEHHEYISRLLEQVHVLQEAEQKYTNELQQNESLHTELQQLHETLATRDIEINRLRGQQLLAGEMKERLEKSYDEFNALRNRLQKMESYLLKARHNDLEYEELQQAQFKLVKEFDELKQRHTGLLEENQRLSRVLTDTEEKLREANFQRQQLLKKVTFMEELNNDLQQIAQQNKKLDSQLKRMSEIEAMLNRVAEQKGGDDRQPE